MIVVRFGICFDHSSTAKSSVAETALQHRRVPLGIISCAQPHHLVEGLVFCAGRNPLTLRERALHSRAHRSEAFAFASMQGTHIPVSGQCEAGSQWHHCFSGFFLFQSSCSPAPAPGDRAVASWLVKTRLREIWIPHTPNTTANPSRGMWCMRPTLCLRRYRGIGTWVGRMSLASCVLIGLPSLL